MGRSRKKEALAVLDDSYSYPYSYPYYVVPLLCTPASTPVSQASLGEGQLLQQQRGCKLWSLGSKQLLRKRCDDRHLEQRPWQRHYAYYQTTV